MTEPDLFSYPKSPGYKESTTSKDAAKAIAGHAKVLRGLVLGCYERAGPAGLTADQCADLLRRDKLSIRPRVSELVADGQLEATNRREKNNSGQSARVWRIKRA